MDQLRFLSNPRNLGFNNIDKQPMPNDFLVQKPMTPIIDRFKLMLKDREEVEDVPPPSTDEIVGLYEEILSELTFNSKPVITDLTIIAGEQREHGEGIADAICARILEVAVEQKLPSLYLLDSIVKNIGKEYIRYFSVRLPEVFCEAYRQVNPSMRPSMRHLFGTWSSVFPPSVLRQIEAQLQFSPAQNRQSSSLTPLRASESPRPTHGIHVNPKYLEARRQFEHSTADSNIQQSRGASSLKIHGKHDIGYGGYDFDNPRVIPTQVGTKKLTSTEHSAHHTSFVLNDDKLLPSSSARTGKSSLPFGIDNEYNSSSRMVETASPSHRGFDCGPNAYSYGNGTRLQGPRALIDAYGTDQRERATNPKATNGIGKKAAMLTWQNTEEEEFDWDDMGPTLANGSLNADLVPGSGFEAHRPVPVENDLRRSGWSGRAQPSAANGSSMVEDDFPSIDSSRGFPGSHNPREAWNFSGNFPQSSQNVFNGRGGGGNFQMPFLSSAGEEKHPSVNGFADADVQRGPLPFASKVSSSSLEPLDPEVPSAWPPGITQKSYPPPLLATLPLQNQIRGKFDLMNPNVDLGLDKPFLGQQQLDSAEPKEATYLLPRFPHQHQQNQPNNAVLRPPFPIRQDIQQNLVRPASTLTPSHLSLHPLNHGYAPPQGQGPFANTALFNPIPPGMQSSRPILNVPNTSMHLPGIMPPLPPGPRPAFPHMMIPTSQNPSFVTPNPPAGPGGALSGLFNSLMAQGLISLTNQAPVQDSVGLEFNSDLLKVRHESAITALYADLPRQCTTCGIRFKCQEDHSAHMDWHVTKNRNSKNHKQKPSRKWFVSVNMWLSGTEALGVDTGPGFLNPTENVVERKDDDEMAVPADEDQNVCALCGEPFDDFYSDETEEWMYKGAVYMNAPLTGLMADMDRSQLGPIVHAKCRPESSVVASDDFGKNGMGNTEEGSQSKRMRIAY